MSKSILILTLFAFLGTSNLFAKEVPSSGEMMFDVVPIRPLGIVSFALGTTIFVAALIYPFRFTFQRPIGEFYGYMEEIELVSE